MGLPNKSDAADQNMNISDTLSLYETITSGDAKTKQQEMAAKLKELEDLTKLVSVLENADNGEGDSTDNVYQTANSDPTQTLDFIQKVTTDTQADAKKKEGEDLLSQTTPDVGSTDSTGKVPVNINGQVYIIDVIPFQAFIEQLKQRLEQTLLNIDTHKMQIAAYIGDTVNTDGSVTTDGKGGIMGALVTAIIAGGDAKAQQTITSATRDLASGLTQMGGLGLTEALQGSCAKEQAVVDKAQNALDSVDNFKGAGASAGQVGVAKTAKEQEVSNAIDELKNGALDFTNEDTHFGSIKTVEKKVEKYTKMTPDEVLDDTTVVSNTSDTTVVEALQAATPEQRLEIKNKMRDQLDKAKKALDTKKQSNAATRQNIQQIIQAGASAGAGGISILNAGLQKTEATQQAIQTEAQNVNSTANDMQSTAKQSASDAKASMKETLDALNAEIRIVNQRV